MTTITIQADPDYIDDRASAVVQAALLAYSTTVEIAAAYAPISHTHGNLTNDGKIGSTSGLPIITGTSGVLQVGAFGTTTGTFAQGDDVRISDAARLSIVNTFSQPQTFRSTIKIADVINADSQWVFLHFNTLLSLVSPTSGQIVFSPSGKITCVGLAVTDGLVYASRTKAAVLASSVAVNSGRFQLSDSGLVGRCVYPDGTNWRYEHDNSIVT